MLLCEIVITTEFTQPMYMLTTLFATSYCRDGGSGYHMAVALPLAHAQQGLE